MRMSRLFSQTLREAPSEAEVASYQWLLRAGFIRQHAAGVFSYLPLARQALHRIEAILHAEIQAIGGQEVEMPIVQPADLWKESGRWQAIDAELGRLKDRNGRDLALAMTHEEAVSDLVRREIRSYRQLPQLIYHIKNKWRDDPRPRAGLIRAREFTMKDSYSLDADWEGLDRQYRAHYQAYFNIFRRCGLDVIAVSADVGMMGGQLAHEFMYLAPIGEDTLILCQRCGYSANRQVARFQKPQGLSEAPLPLEKVATPDCKTIESLANYLRVTHAQTAKAVFLIASELGKSGQSQERFILAVVRGDMEVNETKLFNALTAQGIKARSLRPALEEEIRAVGAEPGYASPVGLKNSAGSLTVTVVVDDLIPFSANLVSGANEAGYHLRHVNYGRDYQADIVADITAAQEGDACPQCGTSMQAVRGVEVGNIFKLGTLYSQAFGCTFLDQDGQEKPVIMGSYGIGLGRLLACIAEAHHDERGLVWPVSVAPYPVHLVLLAGKRGADSALIESQAEQLYRNLQSAGIGVLFDDRPETPGVKFNDADLIGLPIRLTVSERALQQGGVEAKLRSSDERQVIPMDGCISWIQDQLRRLEAEITARLKPESLE